MSDQIAIKIRSWHLIGDDAPKTLCGRVPPPGAHEAFELPMDEKSCESCLRIDKAKETT